MRPVKITGRLVGGVGRRAGQPPRKPAVNGISNSEVRSWAKAEGIEVKECGRIPVDVLARFKVATGR